MVRVASKRFLEPGESYHERNGRRIPTSRWQGQLARFLFRGDMKREINCKDCAKYWDSMSGKYTGEEIYIKEGKLRFPVRCDGCGTNLAMFSQAFTISIWTDSSPYSSWEGQYLYDS